MNGDFVSEEARKEVRQKKQIQELKESIADLQNLLQLNKQALSIFYQSSKSMDVEILKSLREENAALLKAYTNSISHRMQKEAIVNQNDLTRSTNWRFSSTIATK